MATDFTQEQLGAIAYRKLDACVVAGPGSGKTTVLVERYQRLLANEGFTPKDILAITFTEKAAANMKAKLGARDGEHWVSTIHGFCARLLRENAIAAGIDPRFRVLDARESEELQYQCLNESLDELVEIHRAEALDLIDTLAVPAMVGHLKEVYDGMRSAGVGIAEVRAMPAPPAPSIHEVAEEIARLPWPALLRPNQQAQRDAILEWITAVRTGQNLLEITTALKILLPSVPKPNDAWREFREERLPAIRSRLLDEAIATQRELVFAALARFEDLYAQAKNKEAALDFNDLERISISLLSRNVGVRDRVRSQFRQIMLDEFQDINEQQETLLKHIRGEDAFFAVGDINQSIYGFRHAEPDIFRRYRDGCVGQEKHSAQLLHNFRSRPDILRFVEALLNNAEGIEARQLVAGGKFAPKAGPSIEILRAVAEDADEAAVREGKWIAWRIHEMRREMNLEFRDFAVLCRSKDGMIPILDALVQAGIPHVCGRRQSFLVSREGRDITALLQTIANPRDTVAHGTVMRSPLAGISDEGLLASKLNATMDEDDARKMQMFEASLKRWRAEQPVIPLDLLIARMLTDCGYRFSEDVEAFLSFARTRGPGRTLNEFLRDIESMTNALTTESDLSDEDQGNRVQVMTAHAAKGLEYPVTIVAAMHKGVQRNSAPMTFTPQHGLGIKWGREGTYDSWGTANKAVIEDREEAEANRLLYVAMTRAEEHLVLSFAYSKTQRGEWSRKLDEFFGLKEIGLSNEFRVMERDGIAANVLVTDQDPPARLFVVPTAIERADVEHVRPVEDIRQPETSVSVTALNVFAKCPRKYYIQRYIGWTGARFLRFDPETLAEDDGDDESAADLGSAVHDLLAEKPGTYSAEAIQLATVFTRSALGNRATASNRREREWEFIAEISGTLVRGSIDLWFEESGEIHLVDYKTDALKAHETVDRAAFYQPQLALYAHAIEKAMGKRPKSASLHFLKPDVVIEVPLSDATQLVGQLREAQSNLEFNLNEGPHCQSCEFFRSSCPAA